MITKIIINKTSSKNLLCKKIKIKAKINTKTNNNYNYLVCKIQIKIYKIIKILEIYFHKHL